MANVVRDPKAHPDAIIPDLSKPDPLVKFTQGRHRVRVRQQVEAALFHEDRATTIIRLGAQWDVTHQVWRRLSCRAGFRLVDGVLSGRQYAAPYRSALRRLPFGELRHRRPRLSPNGTWAAKSATARERARCASPSRTNIVNPARLDFVACQRCLHPVPFAGTAAGESHQGQVLRLAGRFRSRQESPGLLEAGGAQARRDSHSLISPTARRTRIGCRATTS